jgi:hypothetical protein
MESYLCEDTEELYRRYRIVRSWGDSLIGIAHDYEIARAGLIEQTLKCLEMNRFSFYPDYILCEVCVGGHKELASIIIGKYDCDGNTGLLKACEGNHKELALLLIEYGCNPNYGLRGACIGGHKELALMMVQEIESSERFGDFDWGLAGACEGNNKELALLMLEKGADPDAGWCDMSDDNPELARLLIDWGANVNEGLLVACRNGLKEVLSLLIENGANDWDGGLGNACYSGRAEIMSLMIKKGATVCSECDRQLDYHTRRSKNE